MAHDKMDKESNDEKEEGPPTCKISSFDPEVQPYYSRFQAFREVIICKHQITKTQLKWDAFFKLISWPKPASPQPNT
jgi:hypothetical protein